MSARSNTLGFLVLVLVFGVPLFGGNERPDLSSSLTNTIAKLDREPDLADLILRMYGTSEQELRWASERPLNWGQIAAFAYIQATTGKSFAEMSRENAAENFLTYAENAGMSGLKMAHSLEKFMKQAEKERNSRIFDRLRVSRR